MPEQDLTSEKFYPITSICKADLRGLFKTNNQALKKINELNDADMAYLARKMADAYCNDGYWEDLKIIFEELM